MTPTTSISPAAKSSGVPLCIGTLSKALGAYGGYLCASQPVIDLIRNRARTLIYSTGLPPPIVAAAIAAVDLIEREPDWLAQPLVKAHAFTRAAGLPAGAKRHRSGGDRRGFGGARRLAASRSRRLPRGRDPPADRAGRHRAAASVVQRGASRRRDRTIGRNRPHPHPAQRMSADLHHRDRHRHRQDLCHGRADPAFARSRAATSMR